MEVLMPREEWEDLKETCLLKHGMSERDIRRFRMVFLGALSAATDFYCDLIAGDLSPEEKRKRYNDWIADLEREMKEFEAEMLAFLGEVNVNIQ
jgi:hypothetical protein